MEPRTRWGFTAAAKAELWDRWQRGESLKAIGRAFAKPSSSIYHRWYPSATEMPFEVGTDAGGARRDLARHRGTTIDTLDRKLTGSCALDGQS
jgi:hypothetical protein